MTSLLPPGGGTPRDVATAVNNALKGKLNSTGTVTLTANAATTTVTNGLVSATSIILLMPQTADAVSLDGYAYVKPADITAGTSFKITHDNNAMVDRVYGYAIFG